MKPESPGARILWTAHVRARNAAKARAVAEKVVEALGRPGTSVDVKECRGEPGCWAAAFAHSFPVRNSDEAVCQVLRLASRLARHWEIRLITDDRDRLVDFAGSVAKRIAVRDVMAIGFETSEPCFSPEGLIRRAPPPPLRRR